MFRAYLLGAIASALISIAVQLFPGGHTIDLFYHDTYIVLAPLHVTLTGSALFGTFTGVSRLFERRLQRRLGRFLGYVHFGMTALHFVAVLVAGRVIGSYSPARRVEEENWTVLIALSIAMYAFLPAQILFLINLVWTWWSGRRDPRAPGAAGL